MYCEFVLDIRRDIGQILLIILRKNHGPNPCPMSSQQFLFHSSDWENLSSECDFSRHRHIATHWDLRQSTYQRRCHRNTGRGTILRNCALGNMYMEIEPTVE